MYCVRHRLTTIIYFIVFDWRKESHPAMAGLHVIDIGLPVRDPNEAFSTGPTSVLHTNSRTWLPCSRTLSSLHAGLINRFGQPLLKVLWWHFISERYCLRLFGAFFCFTSENAPMISLQMKKNYITPVSEWYKYTTTFVLIETRQDISCTVAVQWHWQWQIKQKINDLLFLSLMQPQKITNISPCAMNAMKNATQIYDLLQKYLGWLKKNLPLANLFPLGFIVPYFPENKPHLTISLSRSKLHSWEREKKHR